MARLRGPGSQVILAGYLDIVCDFAFYGAVPLAFVVLDPINGLAAAFLAVFLLRQWCNLSGLRCPWPKKARDENG